MYDLIFQVKDGKIFISHQNEVLNNIVIDENIYHIVSAGSPYIDYECNTLYLRGKYKEYDWEAINYEDALYYEENNYILLECISILISYGYDIAVDINGKIYKINTIHMDGEKLYNISDMKLIELFEYIKVKDKICKL